MHFFTRKVRNNLLEIVPAFPVQKTHLSKPFDTDWTVVVKILMDLRRQEGGLILIYFCCHVKKTEMQLVQCLNTRAMLYISTLKPTATHQVKRS